MRGLENPFRYLEWRRAEVKDDETPEIINSDDAVWQAVTQLEA